MPTGEYGKKEHAMSGKYGNLRFLVGAGPGGVGTGDGGEGGNSNDNGPQALKGAGGGGGGAVAGGSGGGDNGGAGERTFTQADLDRVVNERLARERDKYSDYDQLKAQAAAAGDTRTEMQRLADEVKEMRADREQRDFLDLKKSVAEAAGIPLKYAKKLEGKTREELEADAADFAEAFGTKQGGQEQEQRKGPAVQRGRPRENLRGGGTPDDEPVETDPKKLAAMIPRS
ncbi:hypothetical protein ROP_40390 [Rhodococcus opacus B4]|uniref:Scaffolding protein n=2 Tax=Rhodococcus opacus TaxID=37919 RepID=C1B9D3_RHOOB|nr:hypothetical protein ROP_40390 [Rhodococcus opacus B4]